MDCTAIFTGNPFLTILLLGFVIFSWIVAICLFIEEATKKDPELSGSRRCLLWFVGIFLTPIVLGIYVLSMTQGEHEVDDMDETVDQEEVDAEERRAERKEAKKAKQEKKAKEKTEKKS